MQGADLRETAKIGRLHDMRARTMTGVVQYSLSECSALHKGVFFPQSSSLSSPNGKSCMKRPCKVAKKSSSAAISFLGTALSYFLCKFFWQGCAEFSMVHKRTHKSVCHAHVAPSTYLQISAKLWYIITQSFVS